MAVTQSADSSAFNTEGAIKTEEVADLSQSTNNSFLVQGSMSTALGMPQQNDWGMGPPGGGPDMMGMGGPGGMNGMGGDAAGGGPGGGRGGPGGPGGPGGGPGMAMGGGRRRPWRRIRVDPADRADRVAPAAPAVPAGSGGPGGGRGGPDWQGRPNAMAFGNGRRDPRNSYQASLDFSLDNSALDARTFSVTGANLAKPASAAGRGGFMFGGPLRIPKLVPASKRIMFTFNYQMQRNRTGTTSQPVNMPTALERTGDFSQSLYLGSPVTIYDPTTGAPFPGQQDSGQPDQRAGGRAVELLPEPESALRHRRTTRPRGPAANNTQNINSRISNIRIGNKDRINFGLGYQIQLRAPRRTSSSSSTPAPAAASTPTSRGRTPSRRRSSTTCNTTSAGMRQQTSPYFADRQNVAARTRDRRDVAESAELGSAHSDVHQLRRPQRRQRFAQPQPDQRGGRQRSSWVRGAHNFTFGADYRRQQFNQFADSNGRGLTLQRLATSLLERRGADGTGYDLADFLLGSATTSSIRYGNPDKYFRGSGYDFYLNDDWRIAPRFSLILGIRWDYATPVTELYNRLVNLDVAPGLRRHHGRRPAGPDQLRPQQLLAAAGLRLAAHHQGFARGPRRLRHLLQQLGVQRDCRQHGAAAAVRAIAQRLQFGREPAEYRRPPSCRRPPWPPPAPTRSTRTIAWATRRPGT